ncbi:makorin, ring finger protein, 4 isoform X1 [Alosa pseudoharengus]|uniref:makorin, ring finger protein, 4 isoform X1 n=1 Tax=Alosa pseudoharengus TaxID=34774 RepID=UPI003F8B681D
MDRHRMPYRHHIKRSFNVRPKICRHFMNGSCRYGQNCHYLHDYPSTGVCWYFQKGQCWFGDHCRYVHVPPLDASENRRGSAPAILSPARGEQRIPSRRGSEPSVVGSHRPSGQGRRGSEPLVTTNTLERSFERLTTRIAEEEDGYSETTPPHNDEVHSNSVASSTESPPLDQAVSAASGDAQGPSDGAYHAGAAAFVPRRPEESSAYEQSKEVVCGICMDKVYEKNDAQSRRFGILPNCSHAFCIECIVTWRKTKEFQEEVIKACPQCRVKSPYYIPNRYWVENGKPKEALIASFKERSSKLKCRFYSRDGCCPFQSECIYRHEGPPGRPRRRTPRPTAEDFEDSFQLPLMDYIIALTLVGAHYDTDDDDDDDSNYYYYDDDFLESLFLDTDDFDL